MRKFAPLFWLTLFATLLTGCGSSSVSLGLQFELASISRAGDGTTQVAWRISNPNLATYLVAETTHRIYLNGTLVGSIVDKDPVAVPQQTKVDRTSRLIPAGAGADRIVAAAAAAGSASYRLESVLLLRLYGETTDKSTMVNGGQVAVSAK